MRSRVDPAFGLVLSGPATGAWVLAGGDPRSAGPAADRGIAVVDQRVDQDAVLGDVTLDVLVAPTRDRRDFDLALFGVPADDRCDDPVVGDRKSTRLNSSH